MSRTPKTVPIVRLKMVREQRVPYHTISSKRDVQQLLWRIFDGAAVEHVVAIGMDNANVPTIIYRAGIGGADNCGCSPASITKALLLANATGLILVHNHPAGTPHASEADWILTTRMKEACRLFDIALLDHIIVGPDPDFIKSMRELPRWPR